MEELQNFKEYASKAENADDVDSNSSTKVRRKINEDQEQKLEYSTPRKSLRNRTVTTKVRTNVNTGRGYLKSKSRRAILKKNQPSKYVPEKRKLEIESKLMCEGILYHIGDIVSFEDVSGGAYFAQIKGLLSSTSGDKFCIITWLVPKEECDTQTFNPSKFILGYEEEELRNLSFASFVSRCPADYFVPLDAPYEVDNFPFIHSVNRSIYLEQ